MACHEVDFAVGSDTAGSVRIPASYQGLFGFRPTHGAISMAGVVPLAPSYDTVGWCVRRTICGCQLHLAEGYIVSAIYFQHMINLASGHVPDRSFGSYAALCSAERLMYHQRVQGCSAGLPGAQLS